MAYRVSAGEGLNTMVGMNSRGKASVVLRELLFMAKEYHGLGVRHLR